MALTKALLSQADAIRAKRNCDVHQQPPPLDCTLVLQQLPTPDVVTPGSWGEVLRSVGQLLHGFREEDGDGEPDAPAAAGAATGTVAVSCDSALQEALVALGGRVGVLSDADGDVNMEGADGDADGNGNGNGGNGGASDGKGDGAEEEPEEFVPTTFYELPAWMQLALFTACCDALLQTEAFREELKRRSCEFDEREAAIAKEEREKKAHATMQAMTEGAAAAAASTKEGGGPAAAAAKEEEAEAEAEEEEPEVAQPAKLRGKKKAARKAVLEEEEEEGEEKAKEEEGGAAGSSGAAAGEEGGAASKDGGGGKGGEKAALSIKFNACVAPLNKAGVDEATGAPCRVRLSEEEEAEAKTAREAATEALLAAIVERTVTGLEQAVELAQASHHEGFLEDGTPFTSEELKHVLRILAEERRESRKAELHEAIEKESARARLELHKELAMHHEPLGVDADGRRYWLFTHDPSKLWVEHPAAVNASNSLGSRGAHKSVASHLAAAAGRAAGAASGVSTPLPLVDDIGDAPPLQGPSLYCAGEGASRAIKWHWACYDQPCHVAQLVGALEARGASAAYACEAGLRKRLRVALALLTEAAEALAEKDGYDLLPMDDDTTWLVSGHPYLGLRCATQHESGRRGGGAAGSIAIGTIVRWLPAGEDPVEDPVLFHMAHADGDGEDLELNEVLQAVERFASMTHEEVGESVEYALSKSSFGTYENTKARRGQRAGNYGGLTLDKLKSELIDLEEEMRQGLKQVGSSWEGGGSRSERARWLSRLKRAVEVKDVARVAAEYEEALHSVQSEQSGASAQEVNERPPWRTVGHAYVGQPVRRFFPRDEEGEEGDEEGEREGAGAAAGAADEEGNMNHLVSDGRIVSWLPAEGDDPPLWHMVHRDGDEEDLEEMEATMAIQAAMEGRLAPNPQERKVIQMIQKMHREEAKRAAEEAEEESEEEEEEEEEEEDE